MLLDHLDHLTAFGVAASALPDVSDTPRMVTCRRCKGILLGVACNSRGIATVATTRTQECMTDDRGNIGGISFGLRFDGVAQLRTEPFEWKCEDCDRIVKLFPPKPR